MLKMMQADKKKFIPKQGYNLIGVDDFEDPGEQLYLIGHYASQEQAKIKKKQFQKDNPGVITYVYSTKTR